MARNLYLFTFLLFLGLSAAAIAEPQLPPCPTDLTDAELAAVTGPTPPSIPAVSIPNKDVLFEKAFSGELNCFVPSMPVHLPEGVKEIRDIEYGKAGEHSLRLDVYMPEALSGTNKTAPGVILIHGGGWRHGKRQDYKYYAVRFAKQGYVVATVSYRLIGVAPFPACVHDVKCAVRWMRANAAQYNVDPNRIAAVGGSAGGHLAMMLGYSADVPELEGDCGWPGVSSAVQAVVDIYGPFNLGVAEAGERGTVRRFLGGKTFEEAPDLYKLASPSTHLKAGAPPTLILHGTMDTLVPLDQSDQLSARLKELGVPFQYEKFEGYPHVMDVVKEVNWRVQWFAYRFLKEHFGATGG